MYLENRFSEISVDLRKFISDNVNTRSSFESQGELKDWKIRAAAIEIRSQRKLNIETVNRKVQIV